MPAPNTLNIALSRPLRESLLCISTYALSGDVQLVPWHVRYAIPVRPQNLYFFSFVAYFRSGEKLERGGFIRNFNQSDQFTSTVGSQGDVSASGISI
jgi:hypothetical protein